MLKVLFNDIPLIFEDFEYEELTEFIEENQIASLKYEPSKKAFVAIIDNLDEQLEDPSKYTVYRHVNKTNGKIYFGITSTTPKKRWNNGRGYLKHKRFFDDILKYGWDGFKHEILYENLKASQAQEIESNLIQLYNTTNPLKGYNIKQGGELGRSTKK